MGKFGESRGWVGKSGVLEHKSGNKLSSETRKYRGKVTIEGLQELTIALSNGTIPTPYGVLFLKIGCSQPPLETAIAIISGTGKATDCKLYIKNDKTAIAEAIAAAFFPATVFGRRFRFWRL